MPNANYGNTKGVRANATRKLTVLFSPMFPNPNLKRLAITGVSHARKPAGIYPLKIAMEHSGLFEMPIHKERSLPIVVGVVLQICPDVVEKILI